MVKPLNTTTERVPFCVRELTRDGVLGIYSRNATSGICPGTQTGSGHYRCCGINDMCLGYGMCYRNNAGAGRTGYYVAGCNDESYADDVACQRVCAGESRPDVVWESDLGVWRCCGTNSSGQVQCDAPESVLTGAAFLAPGPDELMKMESNETVDGLAFGTATATGTQVAPFATATGSADHSGGHGLSGVAAGGIAVGVIVPFVLIGVVGFFLFQRRRAAKVSRSMEMENMRHWHQ